MEEVEKLSKPSKDPSSPLNVEAKSQKKGIVKKTPKIIKRKGKQEGGSSRGVIYLGHLPHGFFEEQLQSFFSQFGKITRLRMGRSRRTGRSKGYAFIEFQYDEVAKIVAEAMNNYMFFEKILKCKLIPSEKLHPLTFRGWQKTSPLSSSLNRQKQNKQKTPEQLQNNKKKRIARIKKLQSRLSNMGIQYNFEYEHST